MFQFPFLFLSCLQSSKLGAKVWRRFMGVWKTIHENIRYQKCKYSQLFSFFHVSFSSTGGCIRVLQKKNFDNFSKICKVSILGGKTNIFNHECHLRARLTPFFPLFRAICFDKLLKIRIKFCQCDTREKYSDLNCDTHAQTTKRKAEEWKSENVPKFMR